MDVRERWDRVGGKNVRDGWEGLMDERKGLEGKMGRLNEIGWEKRRKGMDVIEGEEWARRVGRVMDVG